MSTENTQLPSQSQLIDVARENTRNNGGDAAWRSDMGFATDLESILGQAESAKNHLLEVEKAQLEKIKHLGQVVCGDCGQVIPCQHAGVKKNGKGFTKGY